MRQCGFTVRAFAMTAAAALIAVIPMLVAYLFLQRYFIAGMTAGAEK